MSCVQLSEAGSPPATPGSVELSKSYLDVACKLFTFASLRHMYSHPFTASLKQVVPAPSLKQMTDCPSGGAGFPPGPVVPALQSCQGPTMTCQVNALQLHYMTVRRCVLCVRETSSPTLTLQAVQGVRPLLPLPTNAWCGLALRMVYERTRLLPAWVWRDVGSVLLFSAPARTNTAGNSLPRSWVRRL